MTRDEQIAQIKGRIYARVSFGMWCSRFCAEKVKDILSDEQCRNEPGHGLGGLFCRQHAKNNPEISDE